MRDDLVHYTSKSRHLLSGGRLEVRQPVFNWDKDVATAAEKILDSARIWMTDAMAKFKSNVANWSDPYDELTVHFKELFNVTPDQQSLNTVAANFTKIQTGLDGNVAIKIKQSAHDTGGYVKRYGFGCSKPAANAQTNIDGKPYASHGEIHLNRLIIGDGSSPPALDAIIDPVRTLVHEAGHKYADLWDVCYFEFNPASRKKPWSTRDDKGFANLGGLRNADSYAHFVKVLQNKSTSMFG